MRPERFADIERIRAVNTAAFGRRTESALVDRLRDTVRPIVSLVADDGRDIVGHIMFSPVSVEGGGDGLLMALGPMAVRPERQRRGIGSDLVLRGLAACERLGCRAVFVLGEPRFYRRFRFQPASRFGIESEYDDAGDAFMAQELAAGALDGCTGKVKYHAAFSEVAD